MMAVRSLFVSHIVDRITLLTARDQRANEFEPGRFGCYRFASFLRQLMQNEILLKKRKDLTVNGRTTQARFFERHFGHTISVGQTETNYC